MLPTHYYLTRLLRNPLARAPYVVLLDLKPLIKDGDLQVYMYCAHARKRASEAPEHTSEHVKSQNFFGACPQTPSHNPFCGPPIFLFALGPPNPLGGPDSTNYTQITKSGFLYSELHMLRWNVLEQDTEIIP